MLFSSYNKFRNNYQSASNLADGFTYENRLYLSYYNNKNYEEIDYFVQYIKETFNIIYI